MDYFNFYSYEVPAFLKKYYWLYSHHTFENSTLNLYPKLVKYVIYPNIEHHILYAAPKKFTKDIIAFLQKVKADKTVMLLLSA